MDLVGRIAELEAENAARRQVITSLKPAHLQPTLADRHAGRRRVDSIRSPERLHRAQRTLDLGADLLVEVNGPRTTTRPDPHAAGSQHLMDGRRRPRGTGAIEPDRPVPPLQVRRVKSDRSDATVGVAEYRAREPLASSQAANRDLSPATKQAKLGDVLRDGSM